MQYIKKYNVILYNKILALRKRERGVELWRRCVNKVRKELKLAAAPAREDVEEVIDIACEYMGIGKSDYYDTVKKFTEYGKNLFFDEIEENYESQAQTDIFWNNIDQKWLCVNIYIQSVAYAAIYDILGKLPLNNTTALDYGCGSGVLAILLDKTLNFKKLVLADLDNYASGFIKFYINKINSAAISWKNVSECGCGGDDTFDLVCSFDVLEHLEDSYGHLLKLDSMVKAGGMMALKIAFEYEDKTHLPQAAESFFVNNDGLGYLKRNYKPVKHFGGGLVSGVYQKLK